MVPTLLSVDIFSLSLRYIPHIILVFVNYVLLSIFNINEHMKWKTHITGKYKSSKVVLRIILQP